MLYEKVLNMTSENVPIAYEIRNINWCRSVEILKTLVAEILGIEFHFFFV
jgi:hypothetical protein